MSAFPTQTSGADDARLELVMAAGRSERRNKPRALLVIAVLVLAASLANLVWTFTSRTAATTSLKRANASLASIRGVIDQLDRVVEQRDDPRYTPDSAMEVKLQNFAGTTGLSRPEVSAQNPSTPPGLKGFRKQVYQTTLPDSDPALLLKWITESCTSFGLEVERLKLTPGRTLENGKVGYSLEIAFRRWERQP